MVILHSVQVIKWKNVEKHPIILSAYIEGNTWMTWFYKNKIVEFTKFFSKVITEKVEVSHKLSITKETFVFHIHKHQNGLAYVFITDNEYPRRVCFDGIQKIKNEIDSMNVKQSLIDNCKNDFEMDTTFLKFLTDTYENFKDPLKVDKILQIKKDIQETKDVLLVSLDKLIEREGKLEELIRRTDMLSEDSKDFYIKAAKTNSCCQIL